MFGRLSKLGAVARAWSTAPERAPRRNGSTVNARQGRLGIPVCIATELERHVERLLRHLVRTLQHWSLLRRTANLSGQIADCQTAVQTRGLRAAQKDWLGLIWLLYALCHGDLEVKRLNGSSA